MTTAPSETSPLLASTKGRPSLSSEPTRVNEDNGTIPDLSADAALDDAVADEVVPDADYSRQQQYEGMPEVRKRMKYMFPAIGIGVFMAAADQTLVVSSYGKIGSDLDALQLTSWIATAYFLTLTSFQPLYGKLSDIFSRKSCLLVAYVFFGAGCLWIGLSPNIYHLIAARALAGVGGGGMTSVVSIILSDVIPLRDRGTWQGYINILFAAGASSGAPLGGLLADSIGWRWAFLLQVPLCAIAFVSVALILKIPTPETKQTMRERLRRIDFLGALVLVTAVFLLIFAFDRGSNAAWGQAMTLGPLGAAVVLLLVFMVVESYIATEPIAPGRVIFERSSFACFLCYFFSHAGWMAGIFYIPLFFQAVTDRTATMSGVLLVPQVVASVSGSLFGGFYMKWTGRYYWLTVICYTTLTVGMGIVTLFSHFASAQLLTRISPAPSVRWTEVGLVIGACVCGFSSGIGVTSALIALIASNSRADQAVATTSSYLFRSLGSTWGVSLGATMANQLLRQRLQVELGSGRDAQIIEREVRRSLDFLRTLEPPDVKERVVSAYAYSLQGAFGLGTLLVFGAFVSAWLVREKPLSSS